MKNKKGKNLKNILDVMEVVLSLISIIILTLSFRMFATSVRYLFLLIDFCVVFSLSRTLSRIEVQKSEDRVIKYSKGKIEPKFIKKIKV